MTPQTQPTQPTRPTEPDAGADRPSFEDLVAELEAVTEQLAGGELGIEAAADLYERAERLHALATERLTQVQERIERLRAEPPAG